MKKTMPKNFNQILLILIICTGIVSYCSAATYSVSDYYHGGLHYLQKKKYNSGINLLSRGIQEYPKSAKLYNLRATIYHLANDLKKAKYDFEKAYELEPDNDSYRFDVDFINDLIKNEERKKQ